MKVRVELDLYNHTLAEYEDAPEGFVEHDGQRYISVDSAYLTVDPTEELFYLFKVVEIVDESSTRSGSDG